MHIPNELERFRNKNLLIFVAGKQDAILYRINGEEVNEVTRVEVPRPHYSDNEGIFQAAPHGRVITGDVEIRQDENVIRDFLHEFEKRTKHMDIDAVEIYYFAPDMSISWIRRSLPKFWQEKITRVEEGNYFHTPILELLAQIREEDRAPFAPISEEEQQILSRPKQ